MIVTPQRRPVGRFGARAVGLRPGQPLRQPPGLPIVVVFVLGPGARAAVRPRQRAPGRHRPGARAGGHAGDPVHLPRPRILIVGGNQVNAADAARRLPETLGTDSSGVPFLAMVDRRRDRHRSATTCAPTGPAASSTRSAPTRRRPPGRHAVAAAGLHRVRCSGALAGLAGVLWAARYHRRLDRRHRLRADGDRRRRRRRRGDLRRQRHACRRRVGALLLVTINSALIVLGIPAFWQQASSAPCCWSAITFDRLVAVRRAAALRRRSAACGTEPATQAADRAARRAAPLGRAARALVRWETLLSPCSWWPLRLPRCLARFLTASNSFNTGRRPGRGRDHGAADDAHHHQRRDRPVGRLGARLSSALIGFLGPGTGRWWRSSPSACSPARWRARSTACS